MSRVRITLSEEESVRARQIFAPIPLTWRDRLWDHLPGLVLLCLAWLTILSVVAGWLFWRLWPH